MGGVAEPPPPPPPATAGTSASGSAPERYRSSQPLTKGWARRRQPPVTLSKKPSLPPVRAGRDRSCQPASARGGGELLQGGSLVRYILRLLSHVSPCSSEPSGGPCVKARKETIGGRLPSGGYRPVIALTGQEVCHVLLVPHLLRLSEGAANHVDTPHRRHPAQKGLPAQTPVLGWVGW